MLKFWKKFRYFAMGAVALQFWGCGIGEFFGNLLGDAVSFTALEFLTDNDGIFDLFSDS
jgi:hypothetical protein